MHIITLSFDDGFLNSNLKIAEIYETYGLSACFNVLSEPSLVPRNSAENLNKNCPLGDFEIWNELQARGHEIAPHGSVHANKSKMPFEEAKRMIQKCLDTFASELANFKAEECIFNFPYNDSTPKIDNWLSTVVAGFRASGGGLNPLPYEGMKKLTTVGFGPENCETHLDQQIDDLLLRDEGWLLYTVHGLENEGWGPLSAKYLDKLLDKFSKIDSVKVLPTSKVLTLYK